MEQEEDILRSRTAVRALIDGRNVATDWAEILVTTDHAIATLLVLLMGSPREAANMLNEGLVFAIEQRLSEYEANN